MLSALGRFCVRHRRVVALAWLAAFVGGIVLGVQVFGRLGTDYSGTTVESFAGYDRLAESAEYGARILALVESDQPLENGTAQAQRVSGAATEIGSVDGVGRVVDPLTAPPQLGLVTADRRAALLVVDIEKDLDGPRWDHAVDISTERLRATADGGLDVPRPAEDPAAAPVQP